MAADNQTFWDQATGRAMSGLLLGIGKQPSFLASQDEGGGSKSTMWGKQYSQGVNPNWQTGGKAPVQVGDENSIGFQSASAKKTMDLLRAKKGLPPLTPAAPTYQYADPMAAYRASLDPSMAFLMDAPVANKTYGAKKGGGGNADALMAEMARYSDAGVNFGTKSGDSAKQIQRMAKDLARYGVNSLSELKAYEVPNPTGKGTQHVFYNTRTGAIIPTQFGSSMKGEGGSTYGLKAINGHIVPVPKWKDTSEASTFAPVAMFAGLALGPALAGLAGSIGSSLATATGLSSSVASGLATAGVQGLAQGTLAAATGGSFGKGFLTGAIGSGIGSAVQAYNPGAFFTSSASIGAGINKAISGGLGAASGALISGGDSTAALLRGAVSGGVSGLLGQYVGQPVAGALGSLAGKATSGLVGQQQQQAQAPQPAGGVVAPAATAPPAVSTTGGYGTTPELGVGYGHGNQLGVRAGIR